MSSDWIEDPVFNYRLRFDRRGDVLLIELEVDPGGGVSVGHYHPAIEERFDVQEGEVTFTADREKIVARPGDPAVVVKPGVRHTFRNTGEGVARMTTEAEPAGNLQGFLTEAAAMARAGRYTKRGIPKGLGALMEAAEFADRYRDDVVLTGGALPPPALQPAMLGPLARIQRRRQAKAGA